MSDHGNYEGIRGKFMSMPSWLMFVFIPDPMIMIWNVATRLDIDREQRRNFPACAACAEIRCNVHPRMSMQDMREPSNVYWTEWVKWPLPRLKPLTSTSGNEHLPFPRLTTINSCVWMEQGCQSPGGHANGPRDQVTPSSSERERVSPDSVVSPRSSLSLSLSLSRSDKPSPPSSSPLIDNNCDWSWIVWHSFFATVLKDTVIINCGPGIAIVISVSGLKLIHQRLSDFFYLNFIW